MKMSPFEVLYARGCRVPINWYSLVDKITVGLEFPKEMEDEMVKIRENMKVAQDRHNNYVDRKRIHREFKAGDDVYILVNPKISSLRMGVCANLAP
jgi:hypothetical protein